MSTPAVTVGIPFHDEEAHLAEAIQSVLGQRGVDLELVLVDDGSTDRSLEIARSFDDPRITVLSDGRRRRLAARLNEITARARGALIARMDADDVSHPERLARQLEVLERDPRCDAVGTWCGLVTEDGEPFAVAEAGALPPTPRSALTVGTLAHATMVARRSWLLAKPYDETLTRTEDRDLWCRTAGTGSFAVVEEPLYIVRLSPDAPRFLDDYRRGQRETRRLFARYGPVTVGAGETARLWLASYAKELVMRGAARVGAAQRIVRRRGRPPTPDERAMIDDALAAARRV
jgi:glycosyltransferase involved in cell wall biosynthesis